MKNNNNNLNQVKDPLEIFNEWFLLAKEKEINDPNAMSLATVEKDLKPSIRMVLMKSFDKNGFVFNTNLNSKKGKTISNNSFVSLNFHWKSLLKQVRIEGFAEKITKEEADLLFDARPENSKIGAWASDQSNILKDRSELELRIQKYKEKYKGKKIPRPDYWSGYRVLPNLYEFWQDMPFRLHDRIQYKKINGLWKVNKLYP